MVEENRVSQVGCCVPGGAIVPGEYLGMKETFILYSSELNFSNQLLGKSFVMLF